MANQFNLGSQKLGDFKENLGIDHYGWAPAFADYKQILEALKSNDEMLVFEAVNNLSGSLSVAQENTLQNFQIDSYIPALIDLLRKPQMSDISNEINMFAIQCLINLMDIFPTICNSMVNHGAIKALCEVMERSMGYIDLNEACIKAFEKISIENPYVILTSGAIYLCLTMMDFFEQSTQKRILQMVLNTSRHSASEQDFDNYFQPILPIFCMLIHCRNDVGGSEKIEGISSVILRLSESFMRFYSPHSQFDKVSAQYEKLKSQGLIEAIVQALYEFSIVDQAMKSSQGSPDKGGQGQKTMSNQTIQNFLKILSLGSRFSFAITSTLLEQNIFRTIDGFIPSQDDQRKQHYSADQFPFIIDSINLLDNLFPERQEQLTSETEKSRIGIETLKKSAYQQQDQGKVAFVAERILPKIFCVYENNMTLGIRTKTLQIIEKIINLFNEELLNNFIEPYSFAKFIYSNLKSHNLPSIQICLQLVKKLMVSNGVNYTLPLMREGILEYVQGLSTEAGFEKVIGSKAFNPIQEKEQSIQEIEQLILTKSQILMQQHSQAKDSESKQFLEQTLQKYVESARLNSIGLNAPIKQQNEQNKSIMLLSKELCSQFFQNEAYMQQIKQVCEDEYLLLSNMKKLAIEIQEEAQRQVFNKKHTKDLMQQLSLCLTNQKHIMSYELKESGLLQAMIYYLTCTPKQVSLYIAKEKGEEMKQSEERLLQIKTAELQKKVSKKEARVYIQRLKIFMHLVLSKVNGKSVLQELVHLCHDLLSQSEHEIFEISKDMQQPSSGSLYQQNADLNASVSALKQLSKRIRVTLVYDQDKKNFGVQQKKDESGIQIMGKHDEVQLHKAHSEHPAFSTIGAQQMKQQSKVYQKRSHLYGELKSVLLSVEQCASLWLLEDFLRNKIRSAADVKQLKTPHSFYESMQKTQRSEKAKLVMNKTMDRLKELMDLGKGRNRSDSEEYAVLLTDEIVNSKELTEEEQVDIIKQLEVQALQMMESLYQQEEGESNDDGNQSFEDRLMAGGEEEVENEQRIYDFHRTIERIKQIFKEKQGRKKKESEKDRFKKMIKESIKNDKISSKSEQNFEMTEEEKKDTLNEDVDMTDEEEEERRHQQMKEEALKMQRFMKYAQNPDQRIEFELESEEFSIQRQDVIGSDLEELIKANGDDIEYEFFLNGQVLNQNQTIFEILKLMQTQKKVSNTSTAFSYGQYSNYAGYSDITTIYFSIKDKQNEDFRQQQRKDSLIEFSQKRQRAMSEAIEDISMSAVDTLVQQLIEREFQVFVNGKEKGDKEGKVMENALKMLKTLNFICKHSNLFSNQGLKLLINQEIDESEEGFTDYDLQIALSQVHPNIFHHHKLDQYILKNIQDPYNIIGGGITDTLQQIFRNCPFLFPFLTRQLFFRLVSFIGAIDMNRSIYFLKAYLKSKGGKISEEKNAIKIQKQKVQVDRTKILECVFTLLKQLNKRAFLEVEYKDEVGTGLGPTMEFYDILADELKVKRAELWRSKMPDNDLFPAPQGLEQISNDEIHKIYEMFRLIGTMIAKSIVDDRLIDLPLSSIFWDLILGKKMNLFDLERIDKDQFKVFAELQRLANKKRVIEKDANIDQEAKKRHIAQLRTYQNARVEDLSLYFVLPGTEGLELKKDGKNLEVDIHNLQEYIDLVMHFTFHETVKIQISAFRKGFNSIFPIDTLKSFSTQEELEEMICGTSRNEEEWNNVQSLSENIVPAHGYHTKSVEFLNFLRFMTELTKGERRKFLKFVTGSPKLPNGGFGALDPKLTVVLKKPEKNYQNADMILPSVMTCQNFVKLPSYSSFEVMKMKFEMAYNEGNNSFTMS